MKTKMYKDVVTWNPFKGCKFDCIYCEPSFKRQAKRQKHNCMQCYNYEPHFHPERLNKIPNADVIFACANGDISFANYLEKAEILKAIQFRPKQTFLLQTKNPRCFDGWRIPSNVIVGTTIETNRETNGISKAPSTEKRYLWLSKLNCRKFVTIEPIIDFDFKILKEWLWNINPEIVWVGYNNYRGSVQLDEPPIEKTRELIDNLNKFTDVRLKTMID